MQDTIQGEEQRKQKCEISEGFERNIERPCNFSAFEKRLAEISSGRSTELRLSWAPDINRYEVNQFFRPVIGKRYAVYILKEHMGWLVYRPEHDGSLLVSGKWKFQRFAKPEEFHSEEDFEVRTERNGRKLKEPELWKKDNKIEQIAFPRWVIEERIPDAVAKKDWDKQRREFEGLELIDWLGDFPKEGLWKSRLVISVHSDNCCNERARDFGFCYGLYRDPGQQDLDAVLRGFRERDEMGQRRNVDEAPTEAELRREELKTFNEIAAGEERMRDLDREIILNAITPTLNAHLFPSVDVGAQNFPEHLRLKAGHRLVLTESDIKAQQQQAALDAAGGIE
jgi:hypothetical protein